MSFETVAKQVQDVLNAAEALSNEAAGKYEDRHKFKWDGPEIAALQRLRESLKAIGDHRLFAQMVHDESNISMPHQSGCECLVPRPCNHKWEVDGDRDVCKLCGCRAHPVI